MLLSKFLDILKCRFDILLVDTPPLLDASGAAPLSSLADGVVLVIKAGHLSVKLVNEAMDRIPNEKIMGAILNQVRIGRDILLSLCPARISAGQRMRLAEMLDPWEQTTGAGNDEL